MQRRIFAAITTLALAIVNIHAQTHAEATSQKWKGIDVTTVLGDSITYPDDNTLESGYPFLLYNVGTGRFVIQGGDWAMEGRLFHPDFGRTMYLYYNGRINGGITESVTATKNSFCVRPPEPQGKSWDQWPNINLTTLLDGDSAISTFKMHWHFERVEQTPSDTCTYYMYQKSSKKYDIKPKTNYNKYEGSNFYLGAAWGECHNETDGKGDGRFVFMDDDRCCWTTANVIGNTNKLPLENGDSVEIQKLYQWRIISMEEFIDVLTQNEVGLNPSISSLIPDRDFTRNSLDFFDQDPIDPYGQWFVSTLAGHTYDMSTEGRRYAYTWANDTIGTNSIKGNLQSRKRYRDEAWNTPLRLKAVFDKVTSDSTNYQSEGKKNAKYGFLPFEGEGTVYTNFKAPKPGWYEIECVGFCQGNNDGYLFARVIADSVAGNAENTFEVPVRDVPHYGKVTLEKIPSDLCNRTFEKNNYESVLEAGKELLKNADNHKQSVWVLVSENDFNNGRQTIRVGVGKDGATKSDPKTYSKKTYYYDTDWVCVDDIRASFMGTGPAFFYEDMETLNYLDDINYPTLFRKHEYEKGGDEGRYGGAAALQRKFTNNAWNTFSFLLPLTGEQVRNAFGDKTELLKLNQVIDSQTKSDCVIDFSTVNLVTTDNVVTPGNLYMLKPSKEPNYGQNPRGKMNYYYDLGKMFFSTKAADASNPEYTFLDLSVWNGSQSITSAGSTNDGAGHVTYIQTPSYSKFRVNSSGIVIRKSTNNYDLGIVDNTYSPKGSYVMSGGKMYELKRDTPLKGFRGWITLTKSIFDNQTEAAAGAKFAIDGVIDGEDPIATSIDRNLAQPVNVRTIAGVYDLTGRKVGDTIENLPKGLYIVSGKKLLVK